MEWIVLAIIIACAMCVMWWGFFSEEGDIRKL